MFFRSAVVALLATYVSATKMLDMDSDIPVSSNFGQEIMMKATVIKEARILNNNNNDYSWMADYSIKYLGCTSLVQIASDGNNNNNKNDGGGMLYSQHLVRFNLCPTSSCSSSCTGGGEYVVNMMDFVDSYTEAKLTIQEYECELIRESCYCDNANDDEVCENQCYTEAGKTECIAYEGENEEFEVQRYLECQEMKAEGGNNNNNNNNKNNYYYGGNGDYYYGSYYIGPYCPDGKSIYLGLFYDAGCSAQADIAQYAARNYGVELPYSKTSLVIANDCIACKEVEVDGNGYEEISIAEVCSNLWSGAARCETNLASAPYPDSYGCDYIENILPKLDAASRSVGTNKSSYVVKEGRAGKAFAFIFAFTTILFASYAYFLYRKIKRGVVALASQT